MASKINPIVYQISNILGVVVVLIVNMLVNIIPLNGVTTGQVSDYYPNLFTPAGYVFSIWGVIYVFAIIFMIYQARSNQREELYLGQISFLYLFSAIINILWLVVFHYSVGVPLLLFLTVGLMALLLLVLLFSYVRLEIGLKEVPTNQKLGVHFAFSIYLGWISLATIANVASALNVLLPGILPDIQILWTVAVLIIALLITTLMLYLRRDFVFALVVIWASIGIAVKQLGIPLILYTASAVAVIVAILIFLIPLVRKTGIVDFYLVR